MSMSTEDRKKSRSSKDQADGAEDRVGMDPEAEAIFEASYERNKEAMERLAKL